MYHVLIIGGLIFIVLPYVYKMLPSSQDHIYEAGEKIPLTEINKVLDKEKKAGGYTDSTTINFPLLTQEMWEKIDWSQFDYNTFNKTRSNS